MGAWPHGYDPRLAEHITLTALEQAANDGRPCPSADVLAELIGVESVSTTVGIVQRLEARGLIAVERYQRERRVTIVKTGKQTAPVKTPAPHWRTRPKDVPSPSYTVIRQRDESTARQLMVAARHAGRDMSDFLADLVWEAWQARCSIQDVQTEG